MSDIMQAIPFGKLIKWIQEEYQEQASIFGIRKDKFYKGSPEARLDWFGEKMGTVLGPAAGPHSQLAQNIIAAYLAGSRFIELKTVQVMDGEQLRACVAKPCINAQDECYNVEWSTELTVEEAYCEYVKAWLVLHVLSKELQLSDDRDFVFNMSVGYDLEGIKSPKINKYLDQMKDASGTEVWQEGIAYLKAHLHEFTYFTAADLNNISPAVCPSITLSTLHGCPPDEIERIVNYLLKEKQLVTFVKCNPTLLGYETARSLLDELGYGYISFDDHHFKADLQYEDAVAMFKRLKKTAEELGLGFGVKLTNTFPVQIKRGELPGEEMYMSGRSLYPLTVMAAKRLSESFDGTLRISYSGGADFNNAEQILGCNIYPITMATTLLKPGGYERIHVLAEMLEPLMKKTASKIDIDCISELQKSISRDQNFFKEAREYKSRKTDSELGLYDCFKAPCKDGGCPIEQQVPEYLNLVAEGKYEEAFRVIAIDNAAPAITSVICDHKCQSKCTRMDYEASLHIRDMKHIAVANAQDSFIKKIKPVPLLTEKKAVVIGAGPAGVAAGLFLRRNGMDVTVLEKQEQPFGIVKYVIPEFRIASSMIEKDYQMAVKAGVNFKFGVSPDYSITELKKAYDYVLIATGAWLEGSCPVKEGREQMTDALDFLYQAKKGTGKIGRRVAVIGGGDVAMDCARVAARNADTEETVIVYRRTEEFMPAEREEIQLAKEDGVVFMELLSPLSYNGKELTCQVMELGEYDNSGRRGVKATDEIKTLAFDQVITAVGAKVDTAAMAANGIRLDQNGQVLCRDSNETSVEQVYIAGDCKKGPATIVKAVADAKAAAKDILAKEGLQHDFIKVDVQQDQDKLYAKKGSTYRELYCREAREGERCLVCDQLCEICNDVCPNRANIHITVDSGLFAQSHQVLHVDGMCNECGNCSCFCPHQGDPYRDKVTVFWTEADFKDSKNKGFLRKAEDTYLVRKEEGGIVTWKKGEDTISDRMKELIAAVENKYSWYL